LRSQDKLHRQVEMDNFFLLAGIVAIMGIEVEVVWEDREDPSISAFFSPLVNQAIFFVGSAGGI